MLPKYSSDAVENENLVERYASRRGSIASQTALILPVILGFTALSVDAAYLFVEQTHQQAAIDGAALAALSGYMEDEDVLRSRAATAMSWNKSMMGETYTIDSVGTDATDDDIETGYWDATAGAFVVADFTTSRNANRPAVRITSPGQVTPLFFAQLFTGPTTNVATQATAARMVIGDGPPANCGILADAQLHIGGSQTADGYVSDDCALGSTGYSAGTRDPATGVCSNDDSKIQGAKGNELYANISYGPGDHVNIVGSPNMHGATTQLKNEVDVPDPITCTPAQQTATDTFMAAPGGCANTADYSYSSITHDFKFNNTKGVFLFEEKGSCHAPTPLCFHDVDIQNGDFISDASTYPDNFNRENVNRDPLAIPATLPPNMKVAQIVASGDFEIGAGARLINKTDTNTSTGLSTGNSAGALRLDVQRDVTLRGGANTSAVITAGRNMSMLGTTAYYGAYYGHGNIYMSGNFNVHIDRCYEISTSRFNGATEVISIPKVVLVQ